MSSPATADPYGYFADESVPGAATPVPAYVEPPDHAARLPSRPPSRPPSPACAFAVARAQQTHGLWSGARQ